MFFLIWTFLDCGGFRSGAKSVYVKVFENFAFSAAF